MNRPECIGNTRNAPYLDEPPQLVRTAQKGPW